MSILKDLLRGTLKLWSLLDQEDIDVVLAIFNFSGSNTYALYRYALSSETSKEIKLLPFFQFEFGKKGYFEKLKVYRRIFSGKVVVGTHYQVYLKGLKSFYVETEHGFPVKAVLLLDRGISIQEAKKISRIRRKVDYFLSASPFYTVGFNAALGFHWSKFVETGCPKNDFLFSCDERILNKLKIPEGKKILVYLPTFRKTLETLGVKSSGRFFHHLVNIPDLDVKSFVSFLELNDLVWVVKAHPLSRDKKVEDTMNSPNIRILSDEDFIRNDVDLYEFLACSDMLLTDYSSVWVDFLLTDKPMLFITPDIDVYRKERGLTLEPYEIWVPGPSAYDQRELQKWILELLSHEDLYHEERNRLKNIMHKFQDSKSSERVWNFIVREILKR